jgi:hypothetical protein
MTNLITSGISKKQTELMQRHGTPSGFAIACYELVPGTISMDEAKVAVEKYQKEWDDAGDVPGHGGKQPPRKWDDIPGYRENMM